MDWIVRLDESALLTVRRFDSPRVRHVMVSLTRAGNVRGWVAHALVVLGVAIAVGQWSVFLHPLAGGIAALCVASVLKRTCRRARPNRRIGDFVALLENPDAFSFPSGHTAVAFGVTAAMATVSAPLALLEAILAVAIGFSRVYLGAHYPLDVAAGALLGSACGWAAIAVCFA
jgi:undecaprenyl-diphosphatase